MPEGVPDALLADEDMQAVFEGRITMDEYIEMERRKQEAMRREIQEVQNARMEVLHAIIGAREKSRTLMTENERMVQTLMQDTAKMAQPGVRELIAQVAQFQNAFHGRMLRPTAEQVAEEIPGARELIELVAERNQEDDEVTAAPPEGGQPPLFVGAVAAPPEGGQVPLRAGVAAALPEGGQAPPFEAMAAAPPAGGQVPLFAGWVAAPPQGGEVPLYADEAAAPPEEDPVPLATGKAARNRRRRQARRAVAGACTIAAAS